MLRAKAASVGTRIAGQPFLRDWLHLELRLASLRLDPDGHPYPGDRRWQLALRGMAASRRMGVSRARRALLGAWFFGVGLLPPSLAARAVVWKMAPAARPAALDRALKKIRRVLG